MSARAYRLWAAIAHELVRLVCDERPSLKHNQIVRALLEHTRGDWIEWKTELTLRDLDAQIAAIKAQDCTDTARTTPVITDNGTELRIRAPWFNPSAAESDEPPASDTPH